MIVALESIDASGKATQSARLAEHLRGRSGSAELQSFPDYTTETGQALLGLLKEDWWPSFATYQQAREHLHLKAQVLQALMTQNRYEKFDLLKQYSGDPRNHLVCDRYFASGLAYGQADGLSLDYLLGVHKALPPADLWLMLDITPEESVKRRPYRRDEYETRAGFLSIVRLHYLNLFNTPPTAGRWSVVNGMQSVEDVHADIIDIVTKFLESR